MGIVVAVKKKNRICIASDTMTISGGSRKEASEHILNPEKIVLWGKSYIGVASQPIWILTLRNYIQKQKKKPLLKSREEIFSELIALHSVLKDEYYLNASNDAGDCFESSGFESLIINSYGIFKTYDLRSVQQFIHFAAIGSGAEYALGAMHVLYDRLETAEEIAKAAITASAAFDDSSSLPLISYTVKTQ